MNLSMSVWQRRRQAVRHYAHDYGMALLKFADRYGLAVLALVTSAWLGWTVANGVSDYTKGGWETHIMQRNLGINIHFHHWYYGIPLGLIALLLIEKQATLSIFLFGLGASLSTHSYVNEGGIPSIFEGGETLRVPTEIYLPAVTLFVVLYAFFIIRREEWLARSREREELAMSYVCLNEHVAEVVGRLNAWAQSHFHKKKIVRDRWTNIEYGRWQAIDREMRGEWQLHYICSPFDNLHHLLVVKLHHVPMIGRKGTLDEWLEEIHQCLKPHAQLALIEDRVIEIEPYEPEVADGPNA